ncbi:catalase [Gemmatimonadetes bacterium T265]|nr:catalase [Gemmatimonadetes bacterium T265]
MSIAHRTHTPAAADAPAADAAPATPKDADLRADTTEDRAPLTTNQGQPVSDDQNSLRAGPRGPTLLEDYILREKLQHFDHERIPERVVHARGAGAHGVFRVYDDALASYTSARVLTDPSLETPVFARFSTVAGSRGSADTARDVRGFAVKMYTPDGVWDLVGNNIPVFFIQDAIKFPDLIHAAKPHPHNEIPQAQTAHDTFWDFVSLTPESMHMIMWIMSDRSIPRAFQMMEGFGVHTFRLVNAAGESTFVKFHWKPALGAHSLVWDEAQRLAGKDPDFHRRTLFDAIDTGQFPEWELGVQLFSEADAARWDFDVLDATKIVPEDLVPVRRVGHMTLNRNPDNYFSETEQVAFNTTHVVPGIDFSDDPLLQGRNFSYLDTQLSRLGSPNFHELPINRSLAPVSNNQRDAHMRHTINKGRVAYAPASLDGHSPDEATPARGGFVSYPEQVDGPKVRARSETFGDHYGQARLFWNSMTPVEREHIAKALEFELSMVQAPHVRRRMVGHLARINETLALQVGRALGEPDAVRQAPARPDGTADSAAETAALAGATSPTTASGGLQRTSGLSLVEGQPGSARGRKVAILVAEGVDAAQVEAARAGLAAAGAVGEVVGPALGMVPAADGAAPGAAAGAAVDAKRTFANAASVLYDAVYVPGGAASAATLRQTGDARAFVSEAYKHGKPIAVTAEGLQLLGASEVGALLDQRGAGDDLPAHGVLVVDGPDGTRAAEALVAALARHRFPDRPGLEQPRGRRVFRQRRRRLARARACPPDRCAPTDTRFAVVGRRGRGEAGDNG